LHPYRHPLYRIGMIPFGLIFSYLLHYNNLALYRFFMQLELLEREADGLD